MRPFPFQIVSLPAFGRRRDAPGHVAWAELREAQAMTAVAMANSSMAVAGGTGESDNIHLKDTRQVGELVAPFAQANQYGKRTLYAGPTLRLAERVPGALRLRFAPADDGLVGREGKAEESASAGDDHKWHWADARIAEDERGPGISAPGQASS